jgi:hypothetical protein
MRMDWRTVNALQNHIVKIHEQPKGTISGLKKALDRYGVLVSEVEANEKERGLDTAGTKLNYGLIKTAPFLPKNSR